MRVLTSRVVTLTKGYRRWCAAVAVACCSVACTNDYGKFRFSETPVRTVKTPDGGIAVTLVGAPDAATPDASTVTR